MVSSQILLPVATALLGMGVLLRPEPALRIQPPAAQHSPTSHYAHWAVEMIGRHSGWCVPARPWQVHRLTHMPPLGCAAGDGVADAQDGDDDCKCACPCVQACHL